MFMLIFHNFKTSKDAISFVRYVKKEFGLKAYFCKDHEEVDKYDMFPFQLKPPMAVVERTRHETEIDVQVTVLYHNGEFAGT